MLFHAQCLNNLKEQLGFDKDDGYTLPMLRVTSCDAIAEQNVIAMLDYIDESKILPDSKENLELQSFYQIHPQQLNTCMTC